MLFQGRFGITTTQMAIQATTAVDPRIGRIGPGHRILHQRECARAGDFEYQTHVQQILRTDQFGTLERCESDSRQNQEQSTETIERRLLGRGHLGLQRVLQDRGSHNRDGRENCHRADALRTLLRDILGNPDMSLRAARDRPAPVTLQDASGRLVTRRKGLDSVSIIN